MAKINRPNTNVRAFASEAQAGERTVFNSSLQSDNLEQNLNSSFRRGFGVFGPSEFPTLEDFNAFGFTTTQLISYLYQQGVAEWAAAQEYHRNSMTSVDGNIYVSTQNNNVGNNPLDGNVEDYTDWQTEDQIAATVPNSSRVVKINEFINGIKIDTSNNVDVFSFNPLGGGGYSSGIDFSDTIDITQSGAMRVAYVRENVFCVLTQTEIGFYVVDLDLQVVASLGNKLALNFTTSSNYQIVPIKGDNLSPATSDFLALYNGDANSIELLEFDGTDIINRGVVYTGLSGNILLAKGSNETQTIVAYSAAQSLFYTLEYNGSAFVLVGTTSTVGFDAFDTIDSSIDNTILTVNSASGSFRVVSTVTSSLFEVGDAYQSPTGELTDVASVAFDDFIAISSGGNSILYISSRTSDPTGSSFWRPLSAQGIGFDSSGTSIQSPNVQGAIKEVVTKLIYPVGSVYENVNFENPNDVLGFGSWQMLKGSFLVGVDPADQDINEGGKTGGSKDFTTEGHALTVDELPSHSHDIILQKQDNNKASEGETYASLDEVAAGDFNGTDTRQTQTTGGGEEHAHTVSNLPPFYAIYRWIRTA